MKKAKNTFGKRLTIKSNMFKVLKEFIETLKWLFGEEDYLQDDYSHYNATNKRQIDIMLKQRKYDNIIKSHHEKKKEKN